MTVKELKDTIASYADNLEVKIYLPESNIYTPIDDITTTDGMVEINACDG